MIRYDDGNYDIYFNPLAYEEPKRLCAPGLLVVLEI